MTPPTNRSTKPSNVEALDIPDSPSRVLVADDELLVAQGIMASLASLGFDVVGPCKNGEEAIIKCREDRPDIALLDIKMPVLDGMQAAQTILRDR